MPTIISKGGIGDAGPAIVIGLAVGLFASLVVPAATPPERTSAVVASPSPSVSPTPSPTPQVERYCAKSHTVHHNAYITFMMIPSGKSFIQMPITHPATDSTVCDSYQERIKKWVQISPQE